MEGEQGPDVLGALPRTRPQRASPRRRAARAPAPATDAAPTPAKRSATRTRAPGSSAKGSPGAARQGPAAPRRESAAEPAPPQGYESEEVPAGTSLSPPGGLELAAGLVEVAAELTRTGMTAVGRLLRAIRSDDED
jgi:hypothetical protein